MKTLMSMLFVCGCVSLAAAQDAGWPTADEYTTAGACDETPAGDQCRENIVYFTRYYQAATKGDYEGQRMMIVAFGDRMDGVLYNPALACAWSHVLIEAGHLQATNTDLKNHKSICDELDHDAGLMALKQSQRMMEMLASGND